MPTYPTGQIREESGLSATTMWRRIVHLESKGHITRNVRAGGSGGTYSEIVFPGSAQALVTLIQGTSTNGKPIPRSSGFDHPRRGPRCKVCQEPMEIGHQGSVWCPKCRRGVFALPPPTIA